MCYNSVNWGDLVMASNKKTEEKLMQLYREICEDGFIYTKEEVLDLFDKYEFEEGTIEILPLTNACDEDGLDDELEDNEFYNSDNIFKDLINYTDEDEFMLELPENIADEILSQEFRRKILSNFFNIDEKSSIFQILIECVYKYHNHKDIHYSSETKNKIGNFIKDCSLNDFISKYIYDDEFSKFVFNSYSIKVFKIEDKKETMNYSTISLNDLVREKIIDLHSKNISIGMSDKDSISMLQRYVNSDICLSNMNDLDHVVIISDLEEMCSKEFVKIIMISDYIRMCELKNGDLDFDEIKCLEYVCNNETKDILNLFKNNKKFSTKIISEFINLNLYNTNLKSDFSSSEKLLKKLNPLYKLDHLKRDK